MYAAGIGCVSGVPCSILEPLQRQVEAHGSLRYLPACIEGEALALAAGTYLGGGQGAVLLQNSGLGNLINPLLSLTVPYQIPVLMWISHRAQPGSADAVHHVPMGNATEPLLDAMAIRHERFDPAQGVAQLKRALAYVSTERRSFAFIVARGALGKAPTRPAVTSRATGLERAEILRFGTAHGQLPSRKQAFEHILPFLEGQRVVSTTGYMSRELSSLGRFDRHFPMQGSMGFAPALGLGIACQSKERGVTILDGDGALLMHLGSLATIAHTRPRPFTHLVFDNQAYVSTGGQPSASSVVDFPALASAAGYVSTADCRAEDGLHDALRFLAEQVEGPRLLRIAIDSKEADAAERPSLLPEQISERFRSGAST